MTKIELVELLTANRGLYYRQLLRKTNAELLVMVEDATDPRTSEQKQADANAAYRAMLSRQADIETFIKAGGRLPSDRNDAGLARKRRMAKRFGSK